MDAARWTRIAIGVAVGAVLGIGLYATGQVWPLSAAVGLIVADVVYASLTLAQTGEWGSMRVAAGLVAFAIATYIGIIGFGDFGDANAVDPTTFANTKTANSWALILTISMVIGAVVTYGLELTQTRRLASLSWQFGTRTYLLMAVGIGVNVILGQTVASALKIPIYLDSIGTILVGVLCGPVAGALTGGLGNVLWSYVIPPPFQYQPAAAFAITAVAIGTIAGFVGRAGFMRPRPNRSTQELLAGGLVTVVLVGILAWAASQAYTKIFQTSIDLLPDPATVAPIFVVLGYLAGASWKQVASYATQVGIGESFGPFHQFFATASVRVLAMTNLRTRLPFS